MRHVISTPTWWIVYHNDRVAHGYSEQGEVIAHDVMTWETYDNKAEWTARLLELGIDIDEQEVEDEID